MTETLKLEDQLIANMIEPGSKVLDLGCGDGALLAWLVANKQVHAQGIELSEEEIYKCVKKGITVLHSDIESGLAGYPDGAFDYVILNESMQEVKKVDFAIAETLRVGAKVVVSFPNFAHWRSRAQLLFDGKSPVTKSLPYSWLNTPNVRFLSIADFKDFCEEKNLSVEAEKYIASGKVIKAFPNLRAHNAIFLISKKG